MEDKLKEAVKVYNKIAKIYSEYNYHKLMQFQLTKFSSMLKGKRVLDAGCGVGRDVEYFLEDGFEPIGIDASRNMIAESKKNVPEGKFKVMDFRKMSFKDNSFDGIWCMASLYHISPKELPSVLKEFNRVLGEKGVLYLSVYEGEGEVDVEKAEYGEEARRIYLYEEKEMSEYLEEAGFEVSISEVNSTEDNKWLEIYARKS